MNQVADDPDLLETMFADLGRAEPIYQPTNYWKRYEEQLLPFLRNEGLRDFRLPPTGRGSDVFPRFGASDPIVEAVEFAPDAE